MIRQLPTDQLLAPAWLDDLCPSPAQTSRHTSFAVRLTARNGLLRLGAVLPDIRAMHADELEISVAQLYADLFSLMEDQEHPYLLRIWNGVPGIVEQIPPPAAESKRWQAQVIEREPFDRYMAFNAGRCAAFHARFGHDKRLGAAAPATTAIGHCGPHLQVHVLAGQVPGVAVENPRQTPAWRYSQRYGPRPPVFVRATRLNDRLLVSGTASIVGEHSLHPGDPHAQFCETYANLCAITEQAGSAPAALRHFRVYTQKDEDRPMIGAKLAEAFPMAETIESMRADICRRNLLLEIEAAT